MSPHHLAAREAERGPETTERLRFRQHRHDHTDAFTFTTMLARAMTDVFFTLAFARAGSDPPLSIEQGDVEVRSAGSRGLGVFAKRHIPKGILAVRYTGRTETATDHNARILAELTSQDYVFQLGKDWHIDAEQASSSSWGRYINHSRLRKNCKAVYMTLPKWTRGLPFPSVPYAVWFETTRPIAPGQELFLDYGSKYWNSRWLEECPVPDPYKPAISGLWQLHPKRLAIDL